MVYERYHSGKLGEDEVVRLKTSISDSLNKRVVSAEQVDWSNFTPELLLTEIIDETPPTNITKNPRLVLSLYRPDIESKRKGLPIFNLDYDGQVILIYTEDDDVGHGIMKRITNRLNGTYDTDPISYHVPAFLQEEA